MCVQCRTKRTRCYTRTCGLITYVAFYYHNIIIIIFFILVCVNQVDIRNLICTRQQSSGFQSGFRGTQWFQLRVPSVASNNKIQVTHACISRCFFRAYLSLENVDSLPLEQNETLYHCMRFREQPKCSKGLHSNTIKC